MCTVVLSFQPSGPVPVLLLGVRDEFTDRAWQPPARHWAASSLPGGAELPGGMRLAGVAELVGGMDEQAGGTWLAVHPGASAGGRDGGQRVACLLNGRGTLAAPGTRRSRGELPLLAASGGVGAVKELAGDLDALAVYDPFHLVHADIAGAMLLSWDGVAATLADLVPRTHLFTNAGYSFPGAPGAGGVAEPKTAYFGPKFAASADPSAWSELADGDGLAPDDPRAIVARRALPDGRTWGTTSQTLVALRRGGVRYRFRAVPTDAVPEEWYEVPV